MVLSIGTTRKNKNSRLANIHVCSAGLTKFSLCQTGGSSRLQPGLHQPWSFQQTATILVSLW